MLYSFFCNVMPNTHRRRDSIESCRHRAMCIELATSLQWLDWLLTDLVEKLKTMFESRSLNQICRELVTNSIHTSNETQLSALAVCIGHYITENDTIFRHTNLFTITQNKAHLPLNPVLLTLIFSCQYESKLQSKHRQVLKMVDHVIASSLKVQVKQK